MPLGAQVLGPANRASLILIPIVIFCSLNESQPERKRRVRVVETGPNRGKRDGGLQRWEETPGDLSSSCYYSRCTELAILNYTACNLGLFFIFVSGAPFLLIDFYLSRSSLATFTLFHSYTFPKFHSHLQKHTSGRSLTCYQTRLDILSSF